MEKYEYVGLPAVAILLEMAGRIVLNFDLCAFRGPLAMHVIQDGDSA